MPALRASPCVPTTMMPLAWYRQCGARDCPVLESADPGLVPGAAFRRTASGAIRVAILVERKETRTDRTSLDERDNDVSSERRRRQNDLRGTRRRVHNVV